MQETLAEWLNTVEQIIHQLRLKNRRFLRHISFATKLQD